MVNAGRMKTSNRCAVGNGCRRHAPVINVKEVYTMKEIRLHGRGGQGVVKASHIVVKAAVNAGGCGQFIPFFGVERKGSPVYGYLRLDDAPIRRKMQVYEPEIILIFDDTLLSMKETSAGRMDGGTVIVNTKKPVSELGLPPQTGRAATVDATGIALELLGKNIPNTTMLGAFARITGLVDWEILQAEIGAAFGEKNRQAAQAAYERVACTQL